MLGAAVAALAAWAVGTGKSGAPLHGTWSAAGLATFNSVALVAFSALLSVAAVGDGDPAHASALLTVLGGLAAGWLGSLHFFGGGPLARALRLAALVAPAAAYLAAAALAGYWRAGAASFSWHAACLHLLTALGYAAVALQSARSVKVRPSSPLTVDNSLPIPSNPSRSPFTLALFSARSSRSSTSRAGATTRPSCSSCGRRRSTTTRCSACCSRRLSCRASRNPRTQSASPRRCARARAGVSLRTAPTAPSALSQEAAPSTVGSYPPRTLPQHDDVAVLFVEIADFASVVAAMTPAKCLELLNLVFYEFDWLTTESGLLKVETVGSGKIRINPGPGPRSLPSRSCPLPDFIFSRLSSSGNSPVFMVAAGIPYAGPDSCAQLGALALKMRARVRGFNGPDGKPLEALMGIHAGPVIGGVIGYKLPRFRLFGDTVNTAARMQTHSMPGEIGLSEAAADRVRASMSREQGRSSASFDSLDIRQISGPCPTVSESEESAGSRGGSSRGRERYQHFAVVDRGVKEVKSKGLVRLFFLREISEAMEAQARTKFCASPVALPPPSHRVVFDHLFFPDSLSVPHPPLSPLSSKVLMGPREHLANIAELDDDGTPRKGGSRSSLLGSKSSLSVPQVQTCPRWQSSEHLGWLETKSHCFPFIRFHPEPLISFAFSLAHSLRIVFRDPVAEPTQNALRSSACKGASETDC